jgi:Domain of unknown function (DUF5666)
MRTLIALLAAALIAAVVTAAALADGPPTTPKTPKAHAGQKFFAGEVIAVGSGSLTVKVDKTGKKDTDLNGQTLTVSVDSSTQITLGKDKTQAQLSDLEVGYRAGVTAKASDTDPSSFAAVKISGHYGYHWFAGTVVSVGSDSITVQVTKTGKHDTQLNGQTLTVPVSSSTQFLRGKNKTPIALGDIKTGDRVGVETQSPNGDLTRGMTAVRVHDRQQKKTGDGTAPTPTAAPAAK